MRRRASLETLVAELTTLTPSLRLDDCPLAGWSESDWRAALLDLPVDSGTFAARFEVSWDQQIATLTAWYAGFRRRDGPQADEQPGGYLGLLLLTFLSLRHSERYRSMSDHPVPGGASAESMGHDCDLICRPLARDPAVREAIRRLYSPVSPPSAAENPNGSSVEPPDSAVHREWNTLDLGTLEFHRHGTTSFILTGRPARATQGHLPTFALKCIIYPYLQMPTIARATRNYATDYGVNAHDDVHHLVRVWASSDSWILMDYVAGETLAELLYRELSASSSSVTTVHELRLDLLEGLGQELFLAMQELEKHSMPHCDLSPSNIIVTDPANDTTFGAFKLIDLGANYLYTHALTGSSGPDVSYVAPEVRSDESSTPLADLYSVGQLLVTFGGVDISADGTVPDGYYAEAPLLARFIEDLIERNPDHRLLVFRASGAELRYEQLRVFLAEELAAVRITRDDRPTRPRWLTAVIELWRPLLGVPRRQRQLWKLRREQLSRDSRRGMHVRWLLFWSLLSAGSWYITVTIVVTWWLRDLDLDWDNQPVVLLQRLTNTPKDQFPYLDLLRAPDYQIPDLAGNLPVRLVGLSFAIIAARYYQGLFASLTPLATGWRSGPLSVRAVTAETLMRMGTVVPAVLILLPTLIERRWWAIATALGVTYIFLCNWACNAFAKEAIRQARARGLSTVPRGKIPGLESFGQWAPSALLYAISTWVVGSLITGGQLKDVYFYASAVAAINIVLFYIIKCGRNLPHVRAGLSRACLAAERIQYVTGTHRTVEDTSQTLSAVRAVEFPLPRSRQRRDTRVR